MSDLISRQYLLDIARHDEAYGYVSEHDILNAPSVKVKGDSILRNEVLNCIDYHIEHKIINAMKPKYALVLLRNAVEELPSAEKVWEIVTCKDCKHYNYDTIFKEGYCNGREMNPTDFCSYGERRNDEFNNQGY